MSRYLFVSLASGVLFGLMDGLILAGIFLLLYASLPGEVGLAKGVSFAFLVWFFRIVMSVASTWMNLYLSSGWGKRSQWVQN